MQTFPEKRLTLSFMTNHKHIVPPSVALIKDLYKDEAEHANLPVLRDCASSTQSGQRDGCVQVQEQSMDSEKTKL